MEPIKLVEDMTEAEAKLWLETEANLDSWERKLMQQELAEGNTYRQIAHCRNQPAPDGHCRRIHAVCIFELHDRRWRYCNSG